MFHFVKLQSYHKMMVRGNNFLSLIHALELDNFRSPCVARAEGREDNNIAILYYFSFQSSIHCNRNRGLRFQKAPVSPGL